MTPSVESGGPQALSANNQLSLPTISIVTPSFNRREYLEETMDSVLGQSYPSLEYVVVDGASTDGSPEIIEKRSGELAWWVSEPDSGAWAAINKGFEHSTGDVMSWLGSDDLLMPWSLSVVGEVFATFPQVEWITTLFPTICDERSRPVHSYYLDAYSADEFFQGQNLPYAGWLAAGFIQQEATYWRRSLWERAGGYLDESLQLAADFELWARFHRAGAWLYSIPVPLAAFRIHEDQKSRDMPAYVDEARRVLHRYGGDSNAVRGIPLLRRVLVRILPLRVRRRGAHALAGLLGPLPTQKGLHIVHGGRGHGWRIEHY